MSDTTTAPVAGPAKRSYGTKHPKVPPFARFEGTSAWRKYKRRARAYAQFKKAQALGMKSA